jgi:hypothetical protein
MLLQNTLRMNLQWLKESAGKLKVESARDILQSREIKASKMSGPR